MRGRVHIVRRTPSHYRLMFVPGGPDRHPIEGEDALRTFVLTDLEIPPGVTETAMTELDNSGRSTIQDILITDKIKQFWRLDTRPQNYRSELSESRVEQYHGGHSPNPNQRGRRGSSR